MAEDPYTLAEIAKIFEVAPSTVRYWVNAGLLTAQKDPKDSRRWVVDRETVDQMVAAGSSPARPRGPRPKLVAPPPPPKNLPPIRNIADRLSRG